MSETIVPQAVYVKVWAALLVLLGATVALAYVPIHALHLPAALVIAFLKTGLIVLFFMQAKYKARMVWVFVGAGLFWLTILFTLSFGDYLTRGWLPHPATWQ